MLFIYEKYIELLAKHAIDEYRIPIIENNFQAYE